MYNIFNPFIRYKLYEITPAGITDIGTATGIKGNDHPVHSFSLEQNYPNPFNPVTVIAYSVPSDDIVKLSVYDMLGKEVAVLINERHSAGIYKKEFNASALSSGVYIQAPGG